MTTRITLKDTGYDVMVKMAEGNPGALTSMANIIEKYQDIDPEAIMGGMGSILLLDTLGIYGSSIYILFNDKCDRDVRKFAIMMRAVQLGQTPQDKLKEWAEDQLRQIPITDKEWEDMETFVLSKLKSFSKQNLD